MRMNRRMAEARGDLLLKLRTHPTTVTADPLRPSTGDARAAVFSDERIHRCPEVSKSCFDVSDEGYVRRIVAPKRIGVSAQPDNTCCSGHLRRAWHGISAHIRRANKKEQVYTLLDKWRTIVPIADLQRVVCRKIREYQVSFQTSIGRGDSQSEMLSKFEQFLLCGRLPDAIASNDHRSAGFN